MALSPEAVADVAAELIAELSHSLGREAHHGKIRRYLKGDHDLPYMPRGAKAEYKSLAKKSITNWLPLISDTFSKGLFVDGFRPAKAAENSKAWEYWQANGLDARQSIAHRGALEYGASYVLVLPGTPAPLIRPLSPTRVIAMYEDEDDEWPVYALIFKGKRASDGAKLYQVLDDEAVWTVAVKSGSEGPEVVGPAKYHQLGVCPLVRFRDRLDGESVGIIEPLINIQDRINEAVFSLMVALQYASFRQRWATGLAIPVDEQETLPDGKPNPNFGKPIEPYQAAVDRLWISDDPNTKFGDFAQTEVDGHLRTYESTVRTLAAIAQVSPLVLLGDLVNLAADALATVQDTTTRKIAEFETIFGESWEQVLRLAALASGDDEAAADTESEIRWRDNEARSLAQTVDALGKMAQMLMVPVEELWTRIPGVTDQDVERWREAAQRADGMAALAEALTRQQTPTPIETPEATPNGSEAV